MTKTTLTPNAATEALFALCEEVSAEMADLESAREVRCQELIKAGADVHARRNHVTTGLTMTPLLSAVFKGSNAICALLIQAGADVSEKSDGGRTPLHTAAIRGQLTTCKLLIDNGADVNARNQDNETPLHGAAHQGHAAVCELLAENNAELNVRDNEGYTPLFAAILRGSQSVSSILIAHGADVNITYANGATSLLRAALYERTSLCSLLVKHGADVTAADADGTTALHRMVKRGVEDACKLFIDRGADVNAKTGLGITPLDIAVEKRYPDIVHMLLVAGSNAETSAGGSDTEWLQSYVAGIASVNLRCFRPDTPDRLLMQEKYFTAGGALNRDVLDTCITDQFHALIVLPLIKAKNPASLELCREIFDALPEHMKVRNNQTAVLLAKCEGQRDDVLLTGGGPGPHASQEEARRESAARGQERGT